jgi:hypothetical protein
VTTPTKNLENLPVYNLRNLLNNENSLELQAKKFIQTKNLLVNRKSPVSII